MIDQYTYELLKRLHEFPCEWDKNKLEFGSFEIKYRAIYGDLSAMGKMLRQLKSLEYIEIPKNTVDFFYTQKGFDAVREYEHAIYNQNQRNLIEEENIRLQNDQFRFQNQLRYKENEIRNLTSENLRLQNKQLKNKIMYAILGGAIAFILSNWKDILIMLQTIGK